MKIGTNYSLRVLIIILVNITNLNMFDLKTISDTTQLKQSKFVWMSSTGSLKKKPKSDSKSTCFTISLSANQLEVNMPSPKCVFIGKQGTICRQALSESKSGYHVLARI